MKLLNIFIDGASRGNPGPAGIGVAINDAEGKPLKKVREYLGETTNNIAEYRALICALENARALKAQEININTDSALLVNQLNKNYKVKSDNLKILYNQVLDLIKNFQRVKVTHIEREKNNEADKLANEAIDNSNNKRKAPGNVAVFENKQDLPDSLF